MNIAGLVILYHPDNHLIRNIQTYRYLINRLYIIDNSENGHNETIEQLVKLDDSILIKDGKNKGIAASLNQGCSLAKNDGFTELLTMDQDSFFSPENISGYLNCVMNFPDKSTVAMFGIQFENVAMQSRNCAAEKVTHLITSGSIINLDLFELIGGFDENLFIDEVDSEYCYRAYHKGYQVVQFKNVFLEHSLGTKSYHKSLKTFRTTIRTLHSPIRLYYMTRNFLYIKAKYKKQFPDAMVKRKQALLNNIKNNILYNKQRMLVCKYILQGYLDYKSNTMGKYKN